jgi:hypothetical protein
VVNLKAAHFFYDAHLFLAVFLSRLYFVTRLDCLVLQRFWPDALQIDMRRWRRLLRVGRRVRFLHALRVIGGEGFKLGGASFDNPSVFVVVAFVGVVSYMLIRFYVFRPENHYRLVAWDGCAGCCIHQMRSSRV